MKTVTQTTPSATTIEEYDKPQSRRDAARAKKNYFAELAAYKEYCYKQKIAHLLPQEMWEWTHEKKISVQQRARQKKRILVFFFAGPGVWTLGPIAVVSSWGAWRFFTNDMPYLLGHIH